MKSFHESLCRLQCSSVIAVPSATAYMLLYDHLLKSTLPAVSTSIPIASSAIPMLAGVISRTLITSAVSPLELLRTNLQSTPLSPSNPHTLRSVFASVRGLVAKRGLSSLWRGLGPSLWRDVPFSGIYWATYEFLKREVKHSSGREGATVAFGCGVIAGSTAAILTSPFDVLKTRRQALLMSSSMPGPQQSKLTSTYPLLKSILRTEGTGALFAGLTPRMAKIAPACGIMIACFEVCMHFYVPIDPFMTFLVNIGYWKVFIKTGHVIQRAGRDSGRFRGTFMNGTRHMFRLNAQFSMIYLIDLHFGSSVALLAKTMFYTTDPFERRDVRWPALRVGQASLTPRVSNGDWPPHEA